MPNSGSAAEISTNGCFAPDGHRIDSVSDRDIVDGGVGAVGVGEMSVSGIEV